MGSLFAALTTAVSGLNAQSSAIGNISDNLANAQTVGYKSVGTNFQELVNASNAAVNNPGGVRATPQYQNDVQGSISSSNTSTSLAISGQGYFAVETATTDSTGTTNFNGQIYYTRQGDFTLDKDGFLVNGSGYYLTGYGLTSTGAVNTSSTAPIQISALLNDPVAATKVTYSANLPSNAAVGYTAPASTLLVYDALGNTHSVNYTWTKTGTNAWNLNVSAPDAIDTNGNAYNASIPYTFNNGSAGTTAGTIGSIGTYTASTPTFTLNSVPTGSFKIGSSADPVVIPWSEMNKTNPATINYTENGVAGSVTGVTLPNPSPTTAAQYAANMVTAFNLIKAAVSGAAGIAGVTASNTGANMSFTGFGTNAGSSITPDTGGGTSEVSWTGSSTSNGTVAQAVSSPYTPTTPTTTGSLADVGVSLTFSGSAAQALTLDFGTYGGSTGVTQFSDTSGTVSVANFSQNGLPKGSFNSVSIDQNGFVALNYSNGTNKTINQIPVVQFYAQDQLQRVTGGAYVATLASGDPRVGAPGTKGAGTLSANSLEQSNVDIATQFTTLIQAQQVYTANAKIVTTDNQLLQVTENMLQ